MCVGWVEALKYDDDDDLMHERGMNIFGISDEVFVRAGVGRRLGSFGLDLGDLFHNGYWAAGGRDTMTWSHLGWDHLELGWSCGVDSDWRLIGSVILGDEGSESLGSDHLSTGGDEKAQSHETSTSSEDTESSHLPGPHGILQHLVEPFLGDIEVAVIILGNGDSHDGELDIFPLVAVAIDDSTGSSDKKEKTNETEESTDVNAISLPRWWG